jgi:aldehyde:ferredoxin oxidoreductase
MMDNGQFGKILFVDLGSGSIEIESPSADFYRRFGGGSCLALALLLQKSPPRVDALAPESPLIFAASVMTGAPLSGLSRFNVTAKSPLTSAIGDSQGGGFWGAELRRAGYIAVVITGRAQSPVYLWIQDDGVEIRPADHLWGLDTAPAQAAIRQELEDPQVRVAQIGPGGENLVRFANIVNDLHHFNGRTGMGAVMGSKQLKAIAVRGKTRVTVHDSRSLLALARSVPERIAGNGGATILHDRGTAGFVLSTSEGGGLPTRNFRSGCFEGAAAIDGEAMQREFEVSSSTCFACAVRCKQVVAAKEPYPIDPAYGGPEYEGLAALGAYTGVSDLAAVCKANELCNRYTLDVISCGGAIALAMEAAERNFIGDEQRDELELAFGNGECLVRLVEMIAHREGIGDILADGVGRMVEVWGPELEALAVHCRGSYFPAHMPRTKTSVGLIYAVNPFGADHISSAHDPFLLDYVPDSLRERMRELAILETATLEAYGPVKVRLVANSQRFYSLLDSLELCSFCFAPGWFFDGADLVTAVRAVTGWCTSLWELLKIGERRINLMRVYNAREGITAEDDQLPPRMAEPLEGGPTDGQALDMETWSEDRALYYAMMGWDEDGIPTEAKLHELELGWVTDTLPSISIPEPSKPA